MVEKSNSVFFFLALFYLQLNLFFFSDKAIWVFIFFCYFWRYKEEGEKRQNYCVIYKEICGGNFFFCLQWLFVRLIYVYVYFVSYRKSIIKILIIWNFFDKIIVLSVQLWLFFFFYSLVIVGNFSFLIKQ